MKYAPARADGDKPFVVTINDWGRTYERLAWGKTAAEARYDATGRKRVGVYATHVRRATPADVDRLPDYS